MGIFKCYIFQTVIILLWGFCKSKFHGKNPTKYTWPLTLMPNYKFSDPLWSCINAKDLKIKWSRRRNSYIEVDCFIPKHQIKNIFSFFLSSLNILCLILIPWRSFIIILSTFCLDLVWKDGIVQYLRPFQKRVIQPPSNCWICCDAGDPVVLPTKNFSLISNVSVSLKQAHWINTSEEVKGKLHEIHKQANRLKEIPLYWGLFLWLIWF